MAFKKSDLKDFVVTRDVEPVKDHGFKINIAVVDDKKQKEIFNKISDFETCKALIKGVEGYLNEDGNEMPVDLFLDDIETLPALVTLCADKCWSAQRDALLKN